MFVVNCRSTLVFTMIVKSATVTIRRSFAVGAPVVRYAFAAAVIVTVAAVPVVSTTSRSPRP